MAKILGECRLCERKILRGHVTKRVRTSHEHEDFIVVHKKCFLEEVGTRIDRQGNPYKKGRPHLLQLFNRTSERNVKALSKAGFILPDEKRGLLARLLGGK